MDEESNYSLSSSSSSSSISRESISSNEGYFYYNDGNNRLIKEGVVFNDNENESGIKTVSRKLYSFDGDEPNSSESLTERRKICHTDHIQDMKLNILTRAPNRILNELDENNYEEVFEYHDDENIVETKIITRKTDSGTTERILITTTLFPNGLTEQEVFVDTSEDHESNYADSCEDLMKRGYEKTYTLNGPQYCLMKKYFRQLELNGLVNRNLFLKHILLQVRERSDLVKVADQKIQECIELTDEDDDGCINFKEMVEFLALFFASKFNIKRKILNILSFQSFIHKRPGCLQKDEANEFFEKLKNFYGAKKSINFRNMINYDDFVNIIYPLIEDNLFVKWS